MSRKDVIYASQWVWKMVQKGGFIALQVSVCVSPDGLYQKGFNLCWHYFWSSARSPEVKVLPAIYIPKYPATINHLFPPSDNILALADLRPLNPPPPPKATFVRTSSHVHRLRNQEQKKSFTCRYNKEGQQTNRDSTKDLLTNLCNLI